MTMEQNNGLTTYLKSATISKRLKSTGDEVMDNIETIITESYNAAFCGLRNTRRFTVPNDKADEVSMTLAQLQIRSVSLETPKGLILSCFTTGIKTDRPFDRNQV